MLFVSLVGWVSVWVGVIFVLLVDWVACAAAVFVVVAAEGIPVALQTMTSDLLESEIEKFLNTLEMGNV